MECKLQAQLQSSLDIPIPTQRWLGQPIKLYIEHHKSVSVLYADVVNYTHITTQLPVKTLVEVLHELFVKFDQASEVRNKYYVYEYDIDEIVLFESPLSVPQMQIAVANDVFSLTRSLSLSLSASPSRPNSSVSFRFSVPTAPVIISRNIMCCG